MKIGLARCVVGPARWVSLTLLAASLLAGCGGGGGGGGCGSLGALVPSSLCDDKSTTPTPVAVNQAPTAVLQAPPSAIVGEGVVLDGTLSRDPEGKALRYTFEIIGAPTGSTAQLSNASGTTASNIFVPDTIGVYQFRLTVNDGTANSAPVEASLTVRRTNAAPVARAIAVAPSALVGQVVALDGSTSYDDDRDLITYSWALVSRPAESVTILNGFTSAQPSFVADRAGSYVVSLTVNDGRVNSPAVTVTVQAGLRNVAPVANIAEVQPVLVGSTVILSGANSSDPNGDNLRFNWSFESKPSGSQLTSLSADKTVRPSFVPDADGDYLVKLVVGDGSLNSEPVFARVNATRANQRPNASIVAPANVTAGQTVLLDGAGSTDPNLDPLTYEWSVISKPQGATAALQGVKAPKATLTADRAGLYVVGLKVGDGITESLMSTHTINATSGNLPPTAVAESFTPSAKVGSQVVLNGASSTDPDPGDLIEYRWTIISSPVGSAAALVNPLTVAPSFVPDVTGLYLVSLTVTDSKQAKSAPANIIIQAGEGNQPPVARVAPVAPLTLGNSVVLDGADSSDPNNDRITYDWKLLNTPATSAVKLILPESRTVRPKLTPDVEGDYLVQLVVSDGILSSQPVVVRVTAARGNQRPTATIAAPSAVTVGQTVLLDGVASLDPNLDRLTYEWSVISKPQSASANLQQVNTSPKATLVADKAGLYVVGLKVRDGVTDSLLATHTINATDGNRPPVADAESLTPVAKVGSQVVLSAVKSADPDGDLINHRWTMVSAPPGSRASLNNPAAVTPNFVPDAVGQYVLGLTVVDGRQLESKPVTLVVQAGVGNQPPVARISPVSPTLVGSSVLLDGSASDDPVDNSRITYQWTRLVSPNGSTASLPTASMNSVRTLFTPDVEGDYLLQLVVNDGSLDSKPEVIRVSATRPSVNRLPEARIVPSTTIVPLGGTVVFDGTGSTDPEGGVLSYTWSLISRPAAASTPAIGTGGLQGLASPKATLSPDVAGSYVVGLRVRDPQGNESAMVTSVVEAAASPTPTPRPIAEASSPTTLPRVGQPLELDGRSSVGFGPGVLNYSWTVLSAPGSADILDKGASFTRIIPNAAGFWVFRLVVDQGRDPLTGLPINPSLPKIVVVKVE